MIREALTFEMIRDLPADEAAALFVARRSEGLTPSEEQLLARWLTLDEANQRMLDGADRAWNWLGDGEDNEILAEMRAHALAPRPRAQLGWRQLAAAAAVVLVVLGGAVRFAPKPAPTGPKTGRPIVLATTSISYVSAIGEVKTIALPDGSRMTLDADSAVVGRFGHAGRSVHLTRGRAFFAVAHDASRPFTVLAAAVVWSAGPKASRPLISVTVSCSGPRFTSNWVPRSTSRWGKRRR